MIKVFKVVPYLKLQAITRSFFYHSGCLVALLLAITFYTACGNQGQEVVVTIGERKITQKQLKERIRQYKDVFSHAAPQETVTPAELKRFFLDQIIDETLIEMEGQKRGLAAKGDKPEQLIRKTMIDLGRKVSYPSGPEVREYYQKHKKSYTVPKQYKITQILVADEHLAWELKEQIEKKQLKMEAAARKYSLGEESACGGYIEAMKLRDFLPEIAKVLPHLKTAHISPVIHSPYGYHLVRLDQILPAGILPFSLVENKVKDDLYAQKLRENFKHWLQEARKQYQVTVQKSQLEAVNDK